jgi:hypothetical protein
MTTRELERDEAILSAASGGDPDAFTAFYRRYERAMLAFFYRRTGDAELAADLTAEVFAAALELCGRATPGGCVVRAGAFDQRHQSDRDPGDRPGPLGNGCRWQPAARLLRRPDHMPAARRAPPHLRAGSALARYPHRSTWQ